MGALYALAREKAIDDRLPVLAKQGPNNSAQAAADSERDSWAPIWQMHVAEASAPWRNLQGHRLQNLVVGPPPLTGQDVKRAALGFADSKGFFLMHPKIFAWLSEATLGHIAALLGACEAHGFWPKVVRYLFLRFLHKKTGEKDRWVW